MNDDARQFPAPNKDDGDKKPAYSAQAPEFITEPFDDSDPMQIAQHLLNVTGIALDRNDYDLFEQFFYLPHVVETFAGKRTVHTRKDLRLLFDNSVYQARSLGVTERVRRCLSAEFRDDGSFVSAHETHMMRGTQLVRDPIPAYSIKKKIGGVWLQTFSAYALDSDSEHSLELLTKHGQPLVFSEE